MNSQLVVSTFVLRLGHLTALADNMKDSLLRLVTHSAHRRDVRFLYPCLHYICPQRLVWRRSNQALFIINIIITIIIIIIIIIIIVFVIIIIIILHLTQYPFLKEAGRD